MNIIRTLSPNALAQIQSAGGQVPLAVEYLQRKIQFTTGPDKGIYQRTLDELKGVKNA